MIAGGRECWTVGGWGEGALAVLEEGIVVAGADALRGWEDLCFPGHPSAVRAVLGGWSRVRVGVVLDARRSKPRTAIPRRSVARSSSRSKGSVVAMSTFAVEQENGGWVLVGATSITLGPGLKEATVRSRSVIQAAQVGTLVPTGSSCRARAS